ncbi:MAG: amidohydrolase family protein [Pseudomonadota bacterium]
MMIDAHQHFWAPARGDYGWMQAEGLEALRRPIGPADYAPHRAAFGIDATVLVQAAPTLAETHYMLGIADATDWVAKVVGWVDFERPEERAALDALAAHPKFAGARPMIQDIPDVDWIHRADVQWGFEALAELDLSLDALGFPQHLDGFLALFQRHPTLRVVVDHCAKPRIRAGEFDDWARGIAAIARETPAFCKLSGLVTEASEDWTTDALRPFAEHVLDVFGPERVMWGSDWPVLELAGTFGAWRAAAEAIVPDAMHADVFGGTAARFYRIGESG